MNKCKFKYTYEFSSLTLTTLPNVPSPNVAKILTEKNRIVKWIPDLDQQ